MNDGKAEQQGNSNMDGKAHGDAPRMVAFESRLLGGGKNQSLFAPRPIGACMNGFGELVDTEEYSLRRKHAELEQSQNTPVCPLRRGFEGEAPAEVIDAVRKVIADWDGLNWIAVRHCIELTRRESESKDLDDWTMNDVRQRFAIGQRVMAIALGGTLQTTDATVAPLEVGTVVIGYEQGANRKPPNKNVQKKLGRKKTKRTREEKQIQDAWRNRNRQFTRTHSELDEVLDLEPGTVKTTLDRLSARERRDRQTTERTK